MATVVAGMAKNRAVVICTVSLSRGAMVTTGAFARLLRAGATTAAGEVATTGDSAFFNREVAGGYACRSY
jgi:hypothetical protein